MKRTLIFDFDGVIHSYVSGWQGVTVADDPPVKGVRELIHELRSEKHYFIAVVSSRCYQEGGIETIEKYLEKHGIKVDAVTAEKPPAVAIIDDRAICFKGCTDTLRKEIDHFSTWHQKKRCVERVDGDHIQTRIAFKEVKKNDLCFVAEPFGQLREFRNKRGDTLKDQLLLATRDAWFNVLTDCWWIELNHIYRIPETLSCEYKEGVL